MVSSSITRQSALFGFPEPAWHSTPTSSKDVVRLIFDKFDELGTVSSLLRYLVRNQILVPVRPHFGPDRGQLQERRPNRVTLTFLPFTRSTRAPTVTAGDRPTRAARSQGSLPVVADWCQSSCGTWLIRDKLPGYISWERYEANLQRLAMNRPSGRDGGAPRRRLSAGGADLLRAGVDAGCRSPTPAGRNTPSLLVPTGRDRVRRTRLSEPAGQRLDDLVARLMLTVLDPAALELSLGAGEDLQRDRVRLDRHRQQRLERPGFEADPGARQYHAVEPENRLVARERNGRWEQALAAGARHGGAMRPLPERPADRTDA